MELNDRLDAQRHALREGALVQAMPELGTLVVTGADRQSWLNGLLTCDVAPLTPLPEGQPRGGPGSSAGAPGRPPAASALSAAGGAYGLSVVKTGKILAEVWLVVAADRIYVGALRERLPLLLETFERYLIMEDAEVRDASEEHGWVFVHGPRSVELVAAGRGAGAEAAVVDWTGLGGALFVAPRGAVTDVATALREGPVSPADRATAEVWDVLRVEGYVPRFGVDFDDQTYPQEASLEGRAVSFNKGCYLGQETVFMLQMRGHAKKRLVQLAIEGDADVPAGAEVTLPDGAAIGEITSRVRDPRGDGVLALGYVKFKHAAQGTRILVAGRPAAITRAPESPG